MSSSTAEPFVDAVKGVFSQMFGLEAQASPARIGDGTEDHEWGVSGILGLAGGAQGIVAIRMPLGMVDALLKASGVESSGEQDREATAAGLVGEIINIIAGNAIAAFPELNLDISPPVVIKGANHQISWPKIAPVMAVRFSTASGDFELGLCFNA